MKGIAEIEIYNTITGETKKYEEHNALTNLLSNVFNDDLYDGCMQRNRDITQYFQKLVLFKEQIDSSTCIAPDNVDILTTLTATRNETIDTSDYYGKKYYFEIPQSLEGTIKCISLAPNYFVNMNNCETGQSSLIDGTRSMTTSVGNNLFKIDIDNNIFWTISSDSTFSNQTYGGNNKYKIYLNKYYHNFKEITLFNNDLINAQLLETTTIDATALVENINPYTRGGYIRYAMDEKNNNLVIAYKETDVRTLNILAVSMDDTSVFEVHKMVFPTNLSPAGGKNNIAFGMLPIYHGRLIFNCLYNDEGTEKRYVTGLNYLDSTDYILYETKVQNNANPSNYPLHTSKQLLGTNEEGCISEYVYLKNNVAYLHNIQTSGTGNEFYYKSKIIRINNSGFYYNMSPYDISTINNLSKSIIKTNAEIIKIQYKILEPKEEEET